MVVLDHVIVAAGRRHVVVLGLALVADLALVGRRVVVPDLALADLVLADVLAGRHVDALELVLVDLALADVLVGRHVAVLGLAPVDLALADVLADRHVVAPDLALADLALVTDHLAPIINVKGLVIVTKSVLVQNIQVIVGDRH